MKKKIMIFFILLLTGCARQMTDKTISVNGMPVSLQVKEFHLSLQFRENYSSKNKVYLIFSEIGDPRVPNNELFFLTPGQAYSDEQKLSDTYYGGDPQKGLQNIYEDYFSTWQKIVLFDGNFLSLNEGPFVSANFHLQYKFNNLNIGYQIKEDTLSFTLDLVKLALKNKFYLKILVVDENQNLKDCTESSFLIEYLSQKTIQEALSANHDIDGALDLISWTGNIY